MLVAGRASRFYSYAPWVAAAVVVVMLRRGRLATGRTCTPTRRGGGDYEVVTDQPRAAAPGSTVASALLVDYVLTVAVSISSAVANIALGRAVRRTTTRSLVAVGADRRC